MVNNDINQYWSKQLRNINKGDKKLWNLAKRFRGKSESTVNKINIPGQVTIDDYGRAEHLAINFEKAHTLTSNEFYAASNHSNHQDQTPFKTSFSKTYRPLQSHGSRIQSTHA